MTVGLFNGLLPGFRRHLLVLFLRGKSQVTDVPKNNGTPGENERQGGLAFFRSDSSENSRASARITSWCDMCGQRSFIPDTFSCWKKNMADRGFLGLGRSRPPGGGPFSSPAFLDDAVALAHLAPVASDSSLCRSSSGRLLRYAAYFSLYLALACWQIGNCV